MWNTFSLPLLRGPGVVEPFRVPSCYKTRSCLDLKKQKEKKEEKKKETEVNTSSSQLRMKS